MRAIPKRSVLVLCCFLVAACGDETEMEDAGMEGMEMGEPAAGGSLADYAGTWEGVTILESGDTVPYTMVATGDTAGWTLTLPDQDPVPVRVVAVEGDSVVTEMGPYESVLREGVMVTVRTVGRLEGDRMVNTVEARYQGAGADSVVRGRGEATRGM
ncbi:MAG TPA: hypothetical protein VMM12_02210 [Longimicrobiales bacterium]|nr:hypothetical protein [Longimicrobiales bacterium]